jgi:16S rRNA (guanine527-N7)-methyltransferase
VKRRRPAELDEALRRYRELVERYHASLDLMSGRGLARWNEHLAEAEAYVEMVASLSPAPRRLLDLGSGVGLPGIVLAASLPDLPVELVERRRKRAAFLRMAAAAVGPCAAEVRAGDVAELPGPPVDIVTAQAVARLAEVVRLTRHRHAAEVVVVARKGRAWRDEVGEIEAVAGSAPTVVAAEARPERGTLVAVRVRGGRACRSSA